MDDDLRAGIDTARYRIPTEGREPDTMLFLGSFRHLPNQEGSSGSLATYCRVFWNSVQTRDWWSSGRIPHRDILAGNTDAIELVGFVDDVMEPLRRYSLFVCPILSGSGVRVKLAGGLRARNPGGLHHYRRRRPRKQRWRDLRVGR